MDISPKYVTGTELKYTVDDLSPGVTYTVECMSSNGEDSCDSSMDMITRKSPSLCQSNLCLYLKHVNNFTAIKCNSVW